MIDTFKITQTYMSASDMHALCINMLDTGKSSPYMGKTEGAHQFSNFQDDLLASQHPLVEEDGARGGG